MDQVKGLDIGTTYLNRKMAMEFSVAIAQCEMTKLRVLFNKSKFFSLVLDEATDVYRLKQCIAYVRLSVRGEIFTKFLSIDSVVRPNAKQITDSIISMMEKTLLRSPPDPENVVSDDMFERSGESETILEMELEGETNIDDESAVLTDFEDDVGSLTTPAHGSEQDDNNSNGELKVQDELAEYEEVSVSLENNEEKHLNSNHPLLVSITTDGANILRGKRSGVSARSRSLCNKLLLYSHCVSHHCQLELKKTAENECELCKDVNHFLESLFVFHKTSNVVTNTYRQSVNELGIRGASSVIRVNGKRWIAHTLNALTNLLNDLPAHIYCYEKLRDSDVGQFIEDPGRRKLWKSRNKWQIQPEDEISIEYRRKFATAIKANSEARCGSDFPPVFYEAMELINPSKWNHEEIFQFDAQSRSIFCKYKPTDFVDKNIELLTSDASIRRQLEHQDVEVDVIKSEWISLKSILSR